MLAGPSQTLPIYSNLLCEETNVHNIIPPIQLDSCPVREIIQPLLVRTFVPLDQPTLLLRNRNVPELCQRCKLQADFVRLRSGAGGLDVNAVDEVDTLEKFEPQVFHAD